MDKRLIIILFFTFFTIISAIIYIKYVICDNNIDLAYYIKWLPAFFLLTQSIILTCYYKYNDYTKYTHYQSVCLIFAYITCIIGDILLIPNKKITFMTGMFIFFCAYCIFAFRRMYHCGHGLFGNNIGYIMAGVFIISSSQLCYVFYIITLCQQNNSYDSTLIIFIFIYSFAINFSISCNYAFLILQKSSSSWFSFIGIILFGISDCILILNDIKYSYIILEIISLSFYWLGLIILSWSIYEKELTEVSLLNIN